MFSEKTHLEHQCDKRGRDARELKQSTWITEAAELGTALQEPCYSLSLCWVHL